jgi:TIR domain
MTELSKAVFLSYATQDATAAHRLAEALRGGGVEVWLDTTGLGRHDR